MKREVWMLLLILGYAPFVNATSLQEEVAFEKQDKFIEDKFIESAILAKKAVRIGVETIASLEANLVFIERLENDPKFVKCVVLKENIKKLDKLAIAAKRLLDKEKVSREDYRDYLNDLTTERSQLNQQLQSKECKEK